MPILGNLSEFPLPEVLLLIGTRTGRLRLLDVPEFGIMDVDFSNGEVQAMSLGTGVFTETDDLIDKLSAVVQAQGGMFEFRLVPVASVARGIPLRVSELVMSLVCHVDEQVAQRRAMPTPEQRYVLVSPQPEIWIEPELNHFFMTARQFLAMGISLNDLSFHLGQDAEDVHKNLTNLRLLGLIALLNVGDTAQLKELDVQEKISRKSNDFLRASRAASEIKRNTSRLPAVGRP